MSYRWVLRLAIEGDLRFFSHHDLMRAMERIVERAKGSPCYSRGFNPRPVLSLLCPRPVGVASRDEVLLLALEAPVRAEELLAALNAQAPEGMVFLSAELLPPGRRHSLSVQRVEYEMPLQPAEAETVANRLETLRKQETWIVPRQEVSARRSSKAASRARPIDLKPLLVDPEVRQGRLRFSCRPHEQKWARPTEILHLLGLCEPEAPTRLVRTGIVCETPQRTVSADRSFLLPHTP